MGAVEIARSYLGTPFKHQGRLPGVGLDCVGVIVCAYKAAGYEVQDSKGYSRYPINGVLMRIILEQVNPISRTEMVPGDFMAFAFRGEPQHLAMVTQLEPLYIIHSYAEAGKVVEHGLGDTWEQRLRGCYRLKGL